MLCHDFLHVFNQNMHLSVSDRYPQNLPPSDTGARNSVPWPRGGLCECVGLVPKQSFNPKLKFETLEISVVFVNPCSVLSCNLYTEQYLPLLSRLTPPDHFGTFVRNVFET